MKNSTVGMPTTAGGRRVLLWYSSKKDTIPVAAAAREVALPRSVPSRKSTAAAAIARILATVATGLPWTAIFSFRCFQTAATVKSTMQPVRIQLMIAKG